VDKRPPVVDKRPPVVDKRPPVVDKRPPVVDKRPPVVDPHRLPETRRPPSRPTPRLTLFPPEIASLARMHFCGVSFFP